MLLTPNVFDPATCPPPFTGAGCPQHLAGSPADLVLRTYNRFLGQDVKTSTTQLEYDFSDRVGGRIGYRLRNRFIEIRTADTALQSFFPTLPNRGACAGQPLDAQGVCQVSSVSVSTDDHEINEHWGIFGIWLRPSNDLRVNFDMEWMSADAVFTRISPRKLQDYSIRMRYQPRPWLNLGSSIILSERSNDEVGVDNAQHYRTYNFDAAVAKSDRWGVDLSYSLQDIFSRSLICFVATPPPPGAISCGATFLETVSLYNNDVNFGSANVYFRPVPRMTANLGYTITSTTGETTNLNPSVPAGPLQINYHQPTGSLEYAFSSHWTGRFGWNHYGYNEKSEPLLVPARDMRGNVFTLSIRFTTGER
jgi:hypothetical protein